MYSMKQSELWQHVTTMDAISCDASSYEPVNSLFHSKALKISPMRSKNPTPDSKRRSCRLAETVLAEAGLGTVRLD